MSVIYLVIIPLGMAYWYLQNWVYLLKCGLPRVFQLAHSQMAVLWSILKLNICKVLLYLVCIPKFAYHGIFKESFTHLWKYGLPNWICYHRCLNVESVKYTFKIKWFLKTLCSFVWSLQYAFYRYVFNLWNMLFL